MQVNISPEMQRFIDTKVQEGQYQSPDDVVRAGLASLMQQAGIAELGKDEITKLFPNLEKEIAEGLADAQAGRLSDGEAFFD